jgi:XTP/dITP diphosphohydrolase
VTLLVATRSEGKQREVRRLLGSAGVSLLFPDEAGVHPDPAEDRLELGDSFAANARAKAEYFAKRTGLPTVADDSGLEIFALGGLPGVRSKRWAGSTATGVELDRANNAELLRRLLGAPAARRRARYRCVLAYLPSLEVASELLEGECAGTILEAPRGDRGFGYDPLFLSDDLGKSFGEVEDVEKDKVSHRGRAFRALLARLANLPQVRPARPSDLGPLLAMLSGAELPTAGVPPSLSTFLVADVSDRLVGAIGLERYDRVALLRSAVVAADARGRGIGAMLVEEILARARSWGVREVYLLTTTADDWFPRFGFTRVDRAALPAVLGASEELKGACPDSAVAMHLALT